MSAKIEKEVFRVPMVYKDSHTMVIEFYICETNETYPHRDIKELGIVVYEGDDTKWKSKLNDPIQLDNGNDFDVEQIGKLIKYLQKAKKHIKTFNER